MTQLMHSFRGFMPPPAVLNGVRSGRIAAFCLFAYNFESLEQLRRLNDALRQAAQEGGHPPPLIGIDQEGGQLMAITGGATELPGNMALAATRSPELAHRAGWVLARELLATGCSLNFAPVLDVNHNPDNVGLSLRTFGSDPALVAQLGRAIIAGMQENGLLATAKHFPGHGDTSIDSHYDVAVINKSVEAMEAEELIPFREAIAAGVGAFMVAHSVYPAWDSERVATVSPAIMKGLIRDTLQYNKLVMTDAMDMHSVARMGTRESIRAALAAGVDLVLLGHIPDQMTLTEEMWPLLDEAAMRRIDTARRHLPTALPSLDIVGCAEHKQVAQDIADAAMTLVRDNGRLPLRLSPETDLAVITVKPVNLTPADTSSDVSIRLAEAVQQRHPRARAVEIPAAASDADVAAVLRAVEKADMVIVGTLTADHDPSQAALVRELHRRGQTPIVVALRTPYDQRAFPEIETYVCAYGIRSASTEAAARALFGEIEMRGQLPVQIPGIM